MKSLLSVCNAVAILSMILVAAIYLPAFDMSFYRAEYEKNNTSQHIGVSEEQLMQVTQQLTDYMRGRADDLVINVEVRGVTREFFDDRDKAHMVDVKELFVIAQLSFLSALCVAVITWVLLLPKDSRLLFRVNLYVLLALFAAFALLVGIIALDFERAFIIFHLIFFDNDLWILDPNVSLLINIVPLEFFINIAIRVGQLFGGMIAGYVALLVYFLRRKTEV